MNGLKGNENENITENEQTHKRSARNCREISALAANGKGAFNQIASIRQKGIF